MTNQRRWQEAVLELIFGLVKREGIKKLDAEKQLSPLIAKTIEAIRLGLEGLEALDVKFQAKGKNKEECEAQARDYIEGLAIRIATEYLLRQLANRSYLTQDEVLAHMVELSLDDKLAALDVKSAIAS